MKKLAIIFCLSWLTACGKEEVVLLDAVDWTEQGLPVYRYEVNGEIIYSDVEFGVSELRQFEQLDYNTKLLEKIKSKNLKP